jgi:hypothetical protein
MSIRQATKWKLSRPELIGPQNPYHQGFHHWPLVALLMLLEKSSDDILSASFLSSSYIYFSLFFLFP